MATVYLADDLKHERKVRPEGRAALSERPSPRIELGAALVREASDLAGSYRYTLIDGWT